MSLTALGLLESGSASAAALTNPAIARCCDAWRSRFKAEMSKRKGEDVVFPAHHADVSYRDAMPPLVDDESIRDFIACAAHGMLIGAIDHKSGTQLLYAAQVALTSMRREPPQAKLPGRPKKVTK